MLGVPRTYRTEAELSDRADRLVDLLDLSELLDEQVAGLPYGDLKRIELATVLATDPDVLLLDEPTSGMGPEESERLGDTLLQLRHDFGLTVLMIEHHVPMVVRVCDYVYCLSFGSMLAHGRPDEVRQHPEVIRAYLGEEAV
jgi:branched-chain amino acid transport system ATP-binding protein